MVAAVMMSTPLSCDNMCNDRMQRQGPIKPHISRYALLFHFHSQMGMPTQRRKPDHKCASCSLHRLHHPPLPSPNLPWMALNDSTADVDYTPLDTSYPCICAHLINPHPLTWHRVVKGTRIEVQCPQKCFKCFGHFDCSTCISLTRVFLRMYIGLLESPDQGLSVNIIYMSIASLLKKIYGILSRVHT